MSQTKNTYYYGKPYLLRADGKAKIMGQSFTHYGDVILVVPNYDTDFVINVTRDMNYTYGGEQGTPITDFENFPLFDREKKLLKELKLKYDF